MNSPNSTPNLFPLASQPSGPTDLPPPHSPRSSSTEKGLPAGVLFFVQGNGIILTKFSQASNDRSRQAISKIVAQCIEMANKVFIVAGQDVPDQRSLREGESPSVAGNMGFAALGCWPKNKMAYGETIDFAKGIVSPGVILPRPGSAFRKNTELLNRLQQFTSAGPG